MMGGGDGKRGADGRLNHGGAWYSGETWPFNNTRPTRFFLHHDNSLSQIKPTDRSSTTTYTYDPRNTVNSDGRCEIAYGPAIKLGFQGMGPRDQIQVETLPGHGTPGMPIASRRDVLVFQTQPLLEDVKMAGNLKAVIKASSDAPDTDFFVKLIDAYPGNTDYPAGYAYPVTDGIIRARYRDGFETPTLMKSGTIYEITIPIQPVANLFKAGHRIRVDISSSSFPNYDINRNTGNPKDRTSRIANNTIYHEVENASFIELPVVP
jgi:putative CocE/NonD family hydrolase